MNSISTILKFSALDLNPFLWKRIRDTDDSFALRHSTCFIFRNEIQIPKAYQRIVNKYPTDPAIIPGSQATNSSIFKHTTGLA